MLFCKYGNAKDYADRTYEELLELRSNVMADIVSFEEEKTPEDNWMKKPGADYEYRLNLEFLADLMQLISKRFQKEHREFTKAINSKEAILYDDESFVSQMKRYTRLMNQAAATDDTGFIEFSLNAAGTIDAIIDGKNAGTVTDMDVTDGYEPEGQDVGGAYLLLETECHNRNSVGAGSWRMTMWEIYSDGSYKKRRIYNLRWDEMEQVSDEEASAGKEVEEDGVLDEEQFDRLNRALDKDIWRNAIIRTNTREEAAWRIVMYDADGNVIKTSGELNSIKGNRNLEAIIASLPIDNNK